MGNGIGRVWTTYHLVDVRLPLRRGGTQTRRRDAYRVVGHTPHEDPCGGTPRRSLDFLPSGPPVLYLSLDS